MRFCGQTPFFVIGQQKTMCVVGDLYLSRPGVVQKNYLHKFSGKAAFRVL